MQGPVQQLLDKKSDQGNEDQVLMMLGEQI